jgi:hypothetical protein
MGQVEDDVGVLDALKRLELAQRWGRRVIPLVAATTVGAAACTSAVADPAATMRLWAEKDRRNCEETGGRWQAAAGVCSRGGP